MKTNDRIVAIDRFRGILIFCMIVFQYFEHFDCFGILAKFAYHTPSLGIEIFPNFAISDIVAPAFFMALALTYRLSFDKSVETIGKRETYIKFLKRDFEIIGFGGCMDTIDGIFDGYRCALLIISAILTVICALLGLATVLTSFVKKTKEIQTKVSAVLKAVLTVLGVIQFVYFCYSLIPVLQGVEFYQNGSVLAGIGMACLISLPFIHFSTLVRAVCSVVMIIMYAIIHNLPGMMEKIDFTVQGGLIGAFSWASMILVFTVFSDFFFYDRQQHIEGKKSFRYLIATVISVAFGIFAAKHLYLNRGSVNTGFVLLTISIAVVLFGLIALTDSWKPKFCIFIWWGENSILLFLLQYLFVNIPLALIPGNSGWTLIQAVPYCFVLVFLITFIAYKLDFKERRIRF